jgi:hypothetical protein
MFRFTIRDLLWLMVVVALACGWFLTSRRLTSIEAKYKPLQATFDSMKEAAAKARMDEQFRNAYDGPPRSVKPTR